MASFHDPTDRGGMPVAVYLEHEVCVIRFPNPIDWLGLDEGSLVVFIDSLLEKLEQLQERRESTPESKTSKEPDGAKTTKSPHQGARIEEMWAWTAIDPTDDVEGIVAIFSPVVGWQPLVGADKDRVMSHRPDVVQSVERNKFSAKLARFTNRVDIETIVYPLSTEEGTTDTEGATNDDGGT
jgi:hypothetical protein